MQTENKMLMANARKALSGKWGLAIGGFVVYELSVIVFSIVSRLILVVIFGKTPITSTLGSMALYLVMGPLLVGVMFFYLSLSRNHDTHIRDLFKGFKDYWRATGTYLLMVLFVVLWTILLIIPGIIAGLSYSQTFYILAEDDSIGPLEAIRKSKKMMYGYKWKLFCLGLRFIGWCLLSILTLGIGFLWLFPYMVVSYAKFYDDVKSNHTETLAPQPIS